MNDGGTIDENRQARAMALLWGDAARPSRGPKPSLSRERIVAAAIAIADADGLAAVSMQRVAADLGVTKMAMYRYVPAKAELTLLMVDAAMGQPPEMDAVAGDWRAGLDHWGNRMWQVFTAHPWILGGSIGLRPIGPLELGWMNAGVAALAGSGLSGAERLDAIELVSGHVRALAQQVLTVTPMVTEAQFLGLVDSALSAHPDRFAALRAAMTDGSWPDGRDQALDFGLQRIMDGIAVLIEQRQEPT